MKTISATAALTMMFLSAGAFAGNIRLPDPGGMTVIEKNQAWPAAPILLAAQ